MPPQKQSVARALMLAVLYAVPVCWLTWPLAAYITTHHPTLGPGSDFDSLYSAWVLAWQSRVLASGSLAIGDANIYHPEPGSLFYGPVAFGALPYFAPVYLLTGNPALACNVLFLGCLTLTAAMVHLVVYSWTRLHSAGLVAAAAFLANRWLFWGFIPRVPHLSVLCYLPLIIFLTASPLLTWPRTALLCLLVIAQGMTDLLYVAPSVLVPMTLLATFHFARRRTRSNGARLLLVVAIAAVVLLVAHVPYFSLAAHNPQLLKQTLWRGNPLFMAISSPWQLMAHSSPLAIPTLVPALILAGGLAALVRWRGTPREGAAWRVALFWMIVGVAISLPVNVRWEGHVYPLPHRYLIQYWPTLGRLFTNPDRLRVAALIAVTLLCGLAFAEILRHLHLTEIKGGAKRFVRAGAAIVVCVLLYVQYEWTIGQPIYYGPRLKPAHPGEVPRDSPVLHELRQSGGPTIELPLAVYPLDAWAHATAMYRSIYHWQPLLNGYGSFWPARFPELMQTAARLPEPDAILQLNRQVGLRFILVRKGGSISINDAIPARTEDWAGLAKSHSRPDLELVAEDDNLFLFRVMAGAAGGDEGTYW